MKGFTSLKGEFQEIARKKKLLIAVIAVLLIPVLYSGTFLWAFWDPYGKVDQLPVAVVNKDKGADFEGEKLTIGKDFVDELKENKKFNWQFVDEAEANRGLENRKYYMKIEVPENFSQNATTLQDVHPKRLELIYTPNEGTNYLSTKIGDSAMEKVKAEVSSEVTKTYAESMFDNIKDVAKGLDDATEGAGKLNDGINDAKGGSDDLHDGINTAKDGAGKLDQGVASAKDGAGKLNSGIGSVHSGAEELKKNLQMLAENSVSFSNGLQSADEGAKRLDEGIQKFGTAVGQMKDGNAKLLDGAKKSQSGTDQLSAGLDQSLAGLNQLNEKLPALTAGTEGLSDGAEALSVNLGKFKGGADQTKEGSAQVAEGLEQLQQKVDAMAKQSSDPQIAALKATIDQLAAGSKKVDGGVNQLSENASLLQGGADKLSEGANAVHDGQSKLGGGINQIAEGQQKLADGAKALSGGQSQLVQGLTVFGGKIGEAQDGINQLSAGSRSLSSGLGQLAQGSGQLQDGTGKLADGSGKLAEGTEKLADGSNGLVNGLGKLSDGSGDLSGGLGKLSDGSGDLSNGMNKLSDGSKELKDELGDGAKDANDVNANNDIYDMFAKPVQLKDDRLNHVPNYGTGFTPYFLSLSLFVGALVFSVIFPLRDPAVRPRNGFSWFLGKFGVLLAVGVFQAVLADLILLNVLGLEVQSLPFFFMMSVLASWTFLAIIQFLVTALDNPGRFIGILILILQLTSSAGTYPIELVPGALQHFTNFLPMTYTISAFRAIISTGDFSLMWHNVSIVLIFLIVPILGTISYLTFAHKREFRNEEQEAAV
ncbi:YhgE/Pip domain-containing protein [Bacillus sp. FJAT-42376]|uniref:YhgE/Pip domain-containing protein n=1 Tax=Bacillus sp. FJAT-42376 TaxID=2014076 RepID=UPI000F4DDD9D|nr:YhgE/Pip domain-containing protein [Bacillus sp. FJAT-42376]AZB42295.1 YhgE/Pip domain-containing protein [Bacillus sp. FJAT-42376]